MNVITQSYLKMREAAKRLSRGQTMTEYALILAAVAIVVFVTYQSMGTDIGSVVNGVNSDLTNAS
jgi:Flp pilus assembly pilin Flp